jgi:protein tyrosine/serine phosphatase
LSDDAYRSAQLFSFNMPYYLEKHKIKTMINLRGARPNQEWYIDEMTITKEYNVTHIDHQISSGGYLDYNQTSQIVAMLKTSKKPLIIHCQGGADRTSLVSALYDYAILHKSKEEARKELRWFYGHLPKIRKKVIAMENSFDNYVEKSELLAQ